MIAYAMMLLTDLENVHKAETIDVRYGTKNYQLDGQMVRAFIRATSHSYHDYPYKNCLEYGLELVPMRIRHILEYLYETLKEVILWNEQECV